MGKGRKPVPTRIKRLMGNPGKRRLPKHEPQPSSAMPRCPSFLDTYARNKWRQLAPELHRLRLLTKVDQGTLACYCQAFSDLKRARKTIDDEGEYHTSDKGYIYPHPAVTQARQAMEQIRKFAVELGLTPSCRVKFGQLGEPAADPLEEFMNSGAEDRTKKRKGTKAPGKAKDRRKAKVAKAPGKAKDRRKAKVAPVRKCKA